MSAEISAVTPDEAISAPGMLEATRIRRDYETAQEGLRAFVSMGLRLIDVKGRLPHGKYLHWCEHFLSDLSRPQLHRAKYIAEGLCELAGIKCLPRETFENLPEEILSLIDGATGYRALLAGIQEYRDDAAEQSAKAACEKNFAVEPDLRDDWEPRVLSGELNWCQALRGMAGQAASRGKNRSDPYYPKLSVSSLVTVRNGISAWADFPEEDRAKFLDGIAGVISNSPDAVLERMEQEIALRRRQLK